MIQEDGFVISYGDGSEVAGDYVSDVFRVGSLAVKSMTFAVATAQYEVGNMGIMGIGFDTNEAITEFGGKPYRNIIDSMADQDLINSRAYSLWLNDLGKSKNLLLVAPAPANLNILLKSLEREISCLVVTTLRNSGEI